MHSWKIASTGGKKLKQNDLHKKMMSVCCSCLYLTLFCLLLRGVVPFSQRKKMLEKARAKNKKPKSSAGISSIPNITVGTQVAFILHQHHPVACNVNRSFKSGCWFLFPGVLKE